MTSQSLLLPITTPTIGDASAIVRSVETASLAARPGDPCQDRRARATQEPFGHILTDQFNSRRSLVHPFRTLKFAAAAAALVAGQAAHAAQDIVDTAVAAGQFTTLVAAVKAAGLVDTLKGPGPFTVFAPTDAAFAKLPPGTVDGLLKDPAKLRSVLTYHVVAGRVMAKDVRTGDVKTVQGQNVALKAEGGGVRINDATVVKADVAATNGVIHAIDTVILPK
jgi:uncharacterized surface protein with fasciclin (FAS1) repeats